MSQDPLGAKVIAIEGVVARSAKDPSPGKKPYIRIMADGKLVIGLSIAEARRIAAGILQQCSLLEEAVKNGQTSWDLDTPKEIQ
jgi:hypothetical protein